LRRFNGQVRPRIPQEIGTVTKKEIVRKIAEDIEETQLKTKEIVQRTFDAIVKTLLIDRRIELRNFGVFEVKLRKKRKARNPRTEEAVEVPAKFVVTFKPGKEMEEKVRNLTIRPEDQERLNRKTEKARKAAEAREAASTAGAAAAATMASPGAAPPTPGDANGSSDSSAADSSKKKPRAKKPAQA